MSVFQRGFNPGAALIAVTRTTPALVHSALEALVRTGTRKLVNPRAAALYTATAHTRTIAPIFHPAGQATALETLEVGLLHLLRDVPLSELDAHPHVIRASDTFAGLGALLVAPGPAGMFRLNAQRLGGRAGSLLYRPISLGWKTTDFNTRLRLGEYGGTAETHAQWELGNVPVPQQLSATPEPVTTGRGLASFCHQDAPYSIPYFVALQLLAARAPLSSRFPVLANEDPFVSGGGRVALECAIAAPCHSAMMDAWDLKWERWRRPRPDQLWRMGIQGQLHPDFRAIGGWIVDAVGDYLPSCYAEGAPVHSDYPSGHAVLAGIGFTVLKAWFADGPVASLGVTNLHAELDLMASHMSYGRCWAGIHTRSSVLQGLMLGQAHAVAYLKGMDNRPVELIKPTTFFGFNGQSLTV